MLKRLCLLLALIALPCQAWALEETSNILSFQSAATVDGNGTAQQVSRYNSLAIDVAITNTATVTFQGTVDGTTYRSLACSKMADASSSATATSSASYQCNVAGLAKVQAPISSCSSCTVTVSGRLSTAALGGGAGGSSGGGTQYDEDTAHTTGDKMTMAGVVRRDANTTLCDTTGDVCPMQVDATGSLKVAIVSGAGSGGTAMTDDAAFTPATTSITPAGAMFDDVAPDSVNEGDGGVVRMSANRNLYSTIRDAAGNERGLNVDTNGAIAIGSIPGTGVEDAAETAGGTLHMIGTVRRDTAASSAGTTGDNATLNTDALGALWVALRTAIQQTNIVPSSGGTFTDGGVITNFTSGAGSDNAIVAAGGASMVTRVYGATICNRDTSTATEIIWRSSTTAKSAVFPVAAGTCLVQALRGDPWATGAANQAMNINSSAAVAISTQVWYTTTNP